jgi:endonuclease/exonuclease/phosphatase family metal-dependent hydrolase
VRVLTWNIWNGGEGRLRAIERVLRAHDADVVALQEANDHSAAERLAARLGMELVYGEANSAFAVAWLSRLAIVRCENHRLAVLDKTLLEVELEDALLFTTHLSAGRRHVDEPRRVAEVDAILSCIGGRESVLVGDFNAVHPDDEIGEPPPEEELDQASRRPIELVLEAGFTDCYRAVNPHARGWTYLAHRLWARLDYVFASQRWNVRRCEVVTDAGLASDHHPVVAELSRSD